MKIYLKAIPHVIKHLGRVLTHVAEHKVANAAINKGISTGKSAVKGAPSASPKPSPLTSNATQTGSKGFHWNIHSPFQFFWHFPWLIPILIVGAYFGLRWYWPKLEIKSNVIGKPLAPYSVYFKKIKALMYHEDKTLVFENNAFMYSKFPNLTWQQYWRIHTGLIIADLLALFFVPTDIFSIFFLIPLFFIIPLVFLGFYGSKRIKAIFGQRDRTLMQMFQVASSAFKYPPGAKLNPSGWVQIQQWGDPQNLDLSGEQQLFRPGSTYMMFPPATPSESQGLRESFERNFNGTVTADNTWEYEWESSNNRVLAKPVPFISDKTVQYPFPDKNPWNIFVLGDAGSGKVASFDVSKTPHLLVAGTSGSGKSVTQRTLLMHALQSPDWRVALVDPKRVELAAYRNHKHVMRVATELDESLELIIDVEKEMQTRYMKMQDESVNFFRNLRQPPPAFLLMIDETYALLAPEKIKNDEGKLRDEMHAQITLLIGSIARLGRAAGVHLMLATQRPDAAVLPGETKSNLDARIAQGRMDTTPSNMTLDSDRATRIPNIKGRAVLRTGQDYTEFQAFFLPEEQLPLVLEMSEALATGRIHISAFEPDAPEEDEMPGKSRFSWLQRLRIPRPTFNAKLPFGLSDKISDFMENRRAIAEENDAHLQAKIEYAKNGGKGDFNAGQGKGADRPRRGSQHPPEGDFEPNQEEGEEELDINSIANAARERGIHADETSLISPRRSAVSSRRVRVDPEASFDDFDEEHLELESFDNDDRDIDEHDYQNALNEERPVRSSIVSRLTRSSRLHSTPALDEEHFENNLETGIEPEYHADHEEITISEALKEIEDLGEALALPEDFSDFNMKDPHLTDLTFDLRNLRPITIEQVIAKADQLGVPISASELREALAYEAVLEAAGMPVPEVSIPTLKERLDPIVDDIDDSNVREYIDPSPIAIPLVDFGPDSKQRDFPDEDRSDYLRVPNSIPMVDKPQEREQNHPILEDAQEIIEIPMPENILPSVSPGIFASTFIPSMPVRPKRVSEQFTQETIAVEELLRDQKALSAEAAAEQAWIPVPVNYNSEPQEAPWMPKDITENPLGGSPFGNLES